MSTTESRKAPEVVKELRTEREQVAPKSQSGIFHTPSPSGGVFFANLCVAKGTCSLIFAKTHPPVTTVCRCLSQGVVVNSACLPAGRQAGRRQSCMRNAA